MPFSIRLSEGLLMDYFNVYVFSIALSIYCITDLSYMIPNERKELLSVSNLQNWSKHVFHRRHRIEFFFQIKAIYFVCILIRSSAIEYLPS